VRLVAGLFGYFLDSRQKVTAKVLRFGNEIKNSKGAVYESVHGT